MDLRDDHKSLALIGAVPTTCSTADFIKAIPKIPNWVIPFVLTAVGVAFGLLLVGADGVLQGVLVNQGYKQIRDQASKSE